MIKALSDKGKIQVPTLSPTDKKYGRTATCSYFLKYIFLDSVLFANILFRKLASEFNKWFLVLLFCQMRLIKNLFYISFQRTIFWVHADSFRFSNAFSHFSISLIKTFILKLLKTVCIIWFYICIYVKVDMCIYNTQKLKLYWKALWANFVFYSTTKFWTLKSACILCNYFNTEGVTTGDKLRKSGLTVFWHLDYFLVQQNYLAGTQHAVLVRSGQLLRYVRVIKRKI